MPKKMRADEAFQALLEGGSLKAPDEMRSMAALVKALEPGARPSADPRFRARLRSELLAKASMTEEDVFAELLEGSPVDAPAELRPLVAIASSMAPRALPLPDVAFRYQLRNRLIAEAAPARTVRERIGSKVAALNERMRRSLRVVASTGMAASLMLGGSAAMAASTSALPGDALYGVKQMRESAQLLVISGETEGLRLLSFAENRLGEVRGLHERQETSQPLYTSTLARMDEQTERGATLIISEFRSRNGAEPAAMHRLESFASEQVSALTTLIPVLPPGVRPAAQDSLALAQDVEERAEAVLANPDCPCPNNPVVVAPSTGSPNTVGCECSSGSFNRPSTEGSNPSSPGAGNNGGNQGTGGNSDGNTGGNDGGGDTDEKTVDIPDVEGTDADDTIEDTINDLIDQLPSLPPLPSPTPSIPPLPLP